MFCVNAFTRIIFVSVLILILFFSNAIARPVGCKVTYWPQSNAYGQVMEPGDLCDEGYDLCKWFLVPECGASCWVYICFGSQETECLVPHLHTVADPAQVQVQCGTSEIFPVYCKALGNKWYEKCAAEACLTGCDYELHIDELADWINGDYAALKFLELYCDCST